MTVLSGGRCLARVGMIHLSGSCGAPAVTSVRVRGYNSASGGGKVAVVTGASRYLLLPVINYSLSLCLWSRGIGYAITKAMVNALDQSTVVCTTRSGAKEMTGILR